MKHSKNLQACLLVLISVGYGCRTPGMSNDEDGSLKFNSTSNSVFEGLFKGKDLMGIFSYNPSDANSFISLDEVEKNKSRNSYSYSDSDEQENVDYIHMKFGENTINIPTGNAACYVISPMKKPVPFMNDQVARETLLKADVEKDRRIEYTKYPVPTGILFDYYRNGISENTQYIIDAQDNSPKDYPHRKPSATARKELNKAYEKNYFPKDLIDWDSVQPDREDQLYYSGDFEEIIFGPTLSKGIKSCVTAAVTTMGILSGKNTLFGHIKLGSDESVEKSTPALPPKAPDNKSVENQSDKKEIQTVAGKVVLSPKAMENSSEANNNQKEDSKKKRFDVSGLQLAVAGIVGYCAVGLAASTLAARTKNYEQAKENAGQDGVKQTIENYDAEDRKHLVLYRKIKDQKRTLLFLGQGNRKMVRGEWTGETYKPCPKPGTQAFKEAVRLDLNVESVFEE